MIGTVRYPLNFKVLFVFLTMFTISTLIFISLALLVYLTFERERIHAAVNRNDCTEVNRILDRHASRLEQRNRLGLTPLLTACLLYTSDAADE